MTKSITLAFVLLAVAAACSAIKQSVPIVQDVDPLPAMTLASLCIETNQDVKRHKFDEDLTSLLTELGIGAPRKEGAFRGECEIWGLRCGLFGDGAQVCAIHERDGFPWQ